MFNSVPSVFKRLYLPLLLGVAFLLGMFLPVNISIVFAADPIPACVNSQCNGLNPQTYQPVGTTICASGATISGTLSKDSMLVERRVSSLCQSKWERTTHTGATTTEARYLAGTLYYGDPTVGSYPIRTSIAVSPNSAVYTPMRGNYQKSFACGMIGINLLSVPVAISDNTCPSNQP